MTEYDYENDWLKSWRRQGVCLGGGGGRGNCQNVQLLLREPKKCALALKKVAHGEGGGGLRHILFLLQKSRN